MEVAANHVTQLVVPVLLFTPQPIASAAAALMIVPQLWLVLSGNFSWLNWITIVLALSALQLPATAPSVPPAPLWYEVLVLAVAALLVFLSHRPVVNMISRRQVMNRSFDPLHLVNTYGAFGSVSRVRYEVVVEGTLDDTPAPGLRLAGVRVQGQARRSPALAPPVRPLPPAPGLADVVRGAVARLRRGVVRGPGGTPAGERPGHAEAAAPLPVPAGHPAALCPGPAVPVPVHELAGAAGDGGVLGTDVRAGVSAADAAGRGGSEVVGPDGGGREQRGALRRAERSLPCRSPDVRVAGGRQAHGPVGAGHRPAGTEGCQGGVGVRVTVRRSGASPGPRSWSRTVRARRGGGRRRSRQLPYDGRVGRSRPVSWSSRQKASGTVASHWSAQSWTSAAERAPARTLATAGCAAQKARAAARRVVPWRSAASLRRSARWSNSAAHGVVVRRPRRGVGQQAGVEGAADDHRHAAPQRLGQQLGRRALVEEGVPARAEHHVDVRVADEPGEHLRLVHARADRAPTTPSERSCSRAG